MLPPKNRAIETRYADRRSIQIGRINLIGQKEGGVSIVFKQRITPEVMGTERSLKPRATTWRDGRDMLTGIGLSFEAATALRDLLNHVLPPPPPPTLYQRVRDVFGQMATIHLETIARQAGILEKIRPEPPRT